MILKVVAKILVISHDNSNFSEALCNQSLVTEPTQISHLIQISNKRKTQSSP